MSTEAEDWHGQEYVEGKDAEKAPPKPHAAPSASGLLRDPGPGDEIQVYSHVEIQGNYGMLCADQQHITLRSVTLAQAQKAKWDYFGLCSSQMTCYDENGKPVHQE